MFKPRYVAALVALTAGVWAAPVMAVAPMEGRTITGNRVDASDPSAVMEYDPNQNITWLRDWNVNGEKTWEQQLAWVSNLQIGAFANWSLPTSRNPDGSGPCEGADCTGSQMGYMWYEFLGNTEGALTNAGPFQNLQPDFYWTGTERDASSAWYFFAGNGHQHGHIPKDFLMYAVAVRPGDVAAAVPEPQTWAMLLLGLGAVTVALRRRPG